MKRYALGLVCLLALAGLLAGNADAWRGINWSSTYNKPWFANGFMLEVGDTVTDTAGNTIFTVGSAGALTWAGTPTYSAATTTFSNVAAAVNIGTASSTTGSKLSIFDGGSDNKPGAIALYADDGSARWLFLSTAGALRIHTAYPTDDDSDGSVIGTLDTSLALAFTSTGGSTGSPDLSVAGYTKLLGALEVDGAAQLDGNVALGNALTDIVQVKGTLVVDENSACPYAATTPEGTFWKTSTTTAVDGNFMKTPAANVTADKLYWFANGKWCLITTD